MLQPSGSSPAVMCSTKLNIDALCLNAQGVFFGPDAEAVQGDVVKDAEALMRLKQGGLHAVQDQQTSHIEVRPERGQLRNPALRRPHVFQGG